jgi:XTP/dITP diphosphohydrolase
VTSGGAPEVVVATGNRGKLLEIRAILAGVPISLCSLERFDAVQLPEEGDDYAENAVAKARAVAAATGLPAVGDDSGLEVDALDGRPGPHSARYGGAGLDDAGRVARLLEELAGCDAGARCARFVCLAAFATPDGRVVVTRGECPGTILTSPRGAGGFGYDPIFQPKDHAVSMAELPAATKNRISHRGRAFLALRPAIERAVGSLVAG